MTDTARYADVVLPATTFLEHYDIAKGYGAYHLQLVQPVIAPVGEARPNHDVFRELGVAARPGRRTDDELGEAGALHGRCRADCLRRSRAALLDGAGRRRPAAAARSSSSTCMPNTPDGRVHLFPTTCSRRRRAHITYSPDPGDGPPIRSA